MSRIGKKPVAIPNAVEVIVEGPQVSIKGPKGALQRRFVPQIQVSVGNGQVQVARLAEGRNERALHGLVRSEISNMIQGVTQGFERVLEINGVGYKVILTDRTLHFSLGRTQPIPYPLPQGIEAKIEKQTVLTISGFDKALVGQTAANIRALRPPDVYKAKGIKYAGEVLIRKEGKTGK
jgi:large subunit ribosomal protein L6